MEVIRMPKKQNSNKAKLINFRLNPEKIEDKQILDFFDQSLLPRTSLIKLALIHEMQRQKQGGNPYLKDPGFESGVSADNPDKSEEAKEESKPKKKKLSGGYDAFSDDF